MKMERDVHRDKRQKLDQPNSLSLKVQLDECAYLMEEGKGCGRWM